MPESREEQLRRLESAGLIDPKCPTCQREVYQHPEKMPADVFMPPHRASVKCESGKHPHCTCSTCF